MQEVYIPVTRTTPVTSTIYFFTNEKHPMPWPLPTHTKIRMDIRKGADFKSQLIKSLSSDNIPVEIQAVEQDGVISGIWFDAGPLPVLESKFYADIMLIDEVESPHPHRIAKIVFLSDMNTTRT
jgi:hypothetical protein